MFLASSERRKFGECVVNLNVIHLNGQDLLPKTMESALNCVSHFMDDGWQQWFFQRKWTDGDNRNDNGESLSFVQTVAGVDGKKCPNIKCCKCQKQDGTPCQ